MRWDEDRVGMLGPATTYTDVEQLHDGGWLVSLRKKRVRVLWSGGQGSARLFVRRQIVFAGKSRSTVSCEERTSVVKG